MQLREQWDKQVAELAAKNGSGNAQEAKVSKPKVLAMEKMLLESAIKEKGASLMAIADTQTEKTEALRALGRKLLDSCMEWMKAEQFADAESSFKELESNLANALAKILSATEELPKRWEAFAKGDVTAETASAYT